MTRDERDTAIEHALADAMELGRQVERGWYPLMAPRLERLRCIQERLVMELDRWDGGR